MQVENVELSNDPDFFSAKAILTYLPFQFSNFNHQSDLIQDQIKNNNSIEASEAYFSSVASSKQYLITYGVIIDKISNTSIDLNNQTSSCRRLSSTYLVLTCEVEKGSCVKKLTLRRGRLIELQNDVRQESSSEVDLRGEVIFCEIKKNQNKSIISREDEEMDLFTIPSFLNLMSLNENERVDINTMDDVNIALFHLREELLSNDIIPRDEIDCSPKTEYFRFDLNVKDTISFLFTSNFLFLKRKEKLRLLESIVEEFLQQRSQISQFVVDVPISLEDFSSSDDIEKNLFHPLLLDTDKEQRKLIREWLIPPSIPDKDNSTRTCFLSEEDRSNQKKIYQSFKKEFLHWFDDDIVSDTSYQYANLKAKSLSNKENIPNKSSYILKEYCHGIKSSPKFFQIIESLLPMEIVKSDFQSNKGVMDVIGIQIIKEFLKRVLPEDLASDLFPEK